MKNILGEPTYNKVDTDVQVIGYKCEYFYVFFTNNEISIYHPDEYNEELSKMFGEIVTNLNNTGDMNTFLNKLTDIYPNYESFYSDNNYIDVKYPLLGFEVIFGATSNNGITLYSNFKGNVTNAISIDDIKINKQIPANIYTNLETNMVLEAESDRVTDDYFKRNPYDENYFLQTDEFTVINNENTYSFYSRDKMSIDSTLVLNNMTNMIVKNNHTFVYGKKDDGIYIYDANGMVTNKVFSGKGNFNIEKVENNTIYFDGTQISF